jgi:hypothetical protein
MNVDFTKEEMDALVQLIDAAVRAGGFQFSLAYVGEPVRSAVMKFGEALKAEKPADKEDANG